MTYTNYRVGDEVEESERVGAFRARGRVIALHRHGVTVRWASARTFETFRAVRPMIARADDYIPAVLRGTP
jgi:hypothetical protein